MINQFLFYGVVLRVGIFLPRYYYVWLFILNLEHTLCMGINDVDMIIQESSGRVFYFMWRTIGKKWFLPGSNTGTAALIAYGDFRCREPEISLYVTQADDSTSVIEI